MNIKITFLGAAECVTGSQYLVEVDRMKILVDCGIYQERDHLDRNWADFHTKPEDIDVVLLTHAHLDHCGLLPKLVREGFNGPIYCTSATAEITEIILLDSAKLQEEDAAYKKRRHEREGRKGPYPEVPLYTVRDAEAAIPYLSYVDYKEPVLLDHGIEATFYDAGHVLGSSILKLEVSRDNEKRTLFFSGDLGRCDKPILNDPTMISEADYVIMESTYGDRLLNSPEDGVEKLADVVNETVEAGGNIVIPSFALERAQELLYYLNEFLLEKHIPNIRIFIDSPMAINVTEVFKHHPELFDEEMNKLMNEGNSPFDFRGLSLTKTTNESKAINYIKEPVIIVAGSGMCTGGRIKHHLISNITRPESTILIVGYQARGTLGRHIVEGDKEVRILGHYYQVQARISRINGFSAHADRDQLYQWVSGLKTPPKRIFITHGEVEASRNFADYVNGKTGWNVTVPRYKEEVLLD
ncbi:MAG: MBL fold metallo-hydrolase [Dehalococcoidia bacterium]